MIFDLVQRAYVINLASRRDRRRAMSRELARIGAGGGVEFFEALRPDDAGEFPSIGAHGCFLSHLGVLKAASATGARSIAIFEDDLVFARDFEARMPAVATALRDTNWSVFYAGWEDAAGALEPGPAPISRVPSDANLRCAHFICFRGEAIGAAHAFLEQLLTRKAGDPRGGPMHVDGAYNHLRRAHPQFDVYAAAPPLGHQRPSRSDIMKLHWYDRTPIVAEAVNLMRRLKAPRR